MHSHFIYVLFSCRMIETFFKTGSNRKTKWRRAKDKKTETKNIDSQFSFFNHRFALDTISVLFGSSFWSCLFSALASGGIFGAIMTFCLVDWGGTIGASIGGLILGFAIVMIAKTLVLLVCRAMFFRALYRKRPAGANFMVRSRMHPKKMLDTL